MLFGDGENRLWNLNQPEDMEALDTKDSSQEFESHWDAEFQP